jgi:hypothetical protein
MVLASAIAIRAAEVRNGGKAAKWMRKPRVAVHQHHGQRGEEKTDEHLKACRSGGAAVPLSNFEAIDGRYPVYRIDPHESDLPR